MSLFQRKTKLIETEFFYGFTDSHNHIIPGVDDGIKTLEDSLGVLNYFEHLKVRKAILTPHVMNGVGNDWEHVTQSFDLLCQHYDGEIELSLGAEYMLDSGFEQRLETGLQHLDKNRVLVETSYMSAPNNLYEQLYNISVSGDTPVIAHPERYLYMSYDDYDGLKNKDCLLQLNLLSLTGYYGTQVMKNAIYLLEQEMYDVAGTDLHNLSTFKSWIEKLKVTRVQLEILLKLR